MFSICFSSYIFKDIIFFLLSFTGRLKVDGNNMIPAADPVIENCILEKGYDFCQKTGKRCFFTHQLCCLIYRTKLSTVIKHLRLKSPIQRTSFNSYTKNSLLKIYCSLILEIKTTFMPIALKIYLVNCVLRTLIITIILITLWMVYTKGQIK